MMQKYTGKVKWFNSDKGFGFLARDGHPEDLAPKCGVFVHYDAIERVDGLDKKLLVKDQLVEFFVVSSEKGLKALHVQFAEGSKDAR
jgi:CspA family cold shock protein